MTNAERTAAFVAMQRRLGLAVKRKKVPRPRPPTLIEADYAAFLVQLVEGWRDRLAPLISELPHMLETTRRERHDELEVTERLGLRIVIENAAGSVRRWVDSDGTEGSTTMRHTYGYIDGVIGADGEDVDVYLGPIAEPDEVFVVHQSRKSSGFTEYDEDKVMLGWPSADGAKSAYLEQYDDPRFFRGMTVFSRADFIASLEKLDGKILAQRARFDVGEGRRTRMLLDRAREGAASAARAVETSADRHARQVAQHGKAQLARQTKAGLGVEVPTQDRSLPSQLEHFAHENAALIKSLGEKYFGEVEKAVLGTYARGDRWETLAAELERRFGITERHARLIARDQIAKLNASIARSRHKELGINQFRWISPLDPPRARVTHVGRHHASHRVPYSYDGTAGIRPPTMPGEEVCCRCGEQPVFDEILSLVDQMLGIAPAPRPSRAPSSANPTAGGGAGGTPPPPRPPPAGGGSSGGGGRRDRREMKPSTPAARSAMASRSIASTTAHGSASLNEVHQAVLDDGSRAIWKPQSGERPLDPNGIEPQNVAVGTYHQREAAASAVAHLLGVEDIVPATVVHVDPVRGPGSLQSFASHAVTPNLSAPISRANAERMRMFDVVIGNSDRHEGNFLHVPRAAGRAPGIVLIDHGLSFPSGKPEFFQQPVIFISLAPGPVLPSTLETIKKIDIGKLAETLVSSGLDEEAVLHTAMRARVLQLHPELLEVPSGPVHNLMWNTTVPNAVDRLPEAEKNAISAMVRKKFRR